MNFFRRLFSTPKTRATDDLTRRKAYIAEQWAILARQQHKLGLQKAEYQRQYEELKEQLRTV